MPHFGQVVTAMVTPFDKDGNLNYEEACKLAEYLINNGTDTILLAGTTGESPTLSHEEEFQLFKEVIGTVGGRGKTMAGTGSNCTKTAIKATKQAEKYGIDSILQVCPYYNKPSQEGLVQHFTAVAEATSLPILLYNIPGRTGVNMEPLTTATLAEIDNIKGIKEASGKLEQVIEINQLTDKNFDIYSGDDALTVSFIKEGAVGVVSVASHIVGNDIQTIVSQANAGHIKDAENLSKKLQGLFEVLFITSSPSPVKAALNLMGFSVGGPRLPLMPVNASQLQEIKDVLRELSII